MKQRLQRQRQKVIEKELESDHRHESIQAAFSSKNSKLFSIISLAGMRVNYVSMMSGVRLSDVAKAESFRDPAFRHRHFHDVSLKLAMEVPQSLLERLWCVVEKGGDCWREEYRGGGMMLNHDLVHQLCVA